MCHFGTEKTREELRKQVYEAMAEKEKLDSPGSKIESEDVKNDAAVSEAPEKHKAEEGASFAGEDNSVEGTGDVKNVLAKDDDEETKEKGEETEESNPETEQAASSEG